MRFIARPFGYGGDMSGAADALPSGMGDVKRLLEETVIDGSSMT